MLHVGKYAWNIDTKRIFKKLLKILISEIPNYFLHLLLEENSLYNLLWSISFSDAGAAIYGGAKLIQIGKIWPLTSKISVRQRDPSYFSLEFG